MLIEMRSISEIQPYDNNPCLNDPAVDAVGPFPLPLKE
jgi:hypothetical protein